ncbi:MAG TPA: S41 family peptidase [Thermoplasmataceae archaeon]|nr:S41 family peptidase [Thermoplasmataceae archaeon]
MASYYSYPAVSGNNIVFTSEDDLWLHDTKKASIARIVSNSGVIASPSFSPDGKNIAFVLKRGENSTVSEIFAIPTEGGEIRQLTHMGSPGTDIAGWTPDGKLVVSSDMKNPFSRVNELFTLDLMGGYPVPVGYGPATSIIYRGQTIFLGRNTNDLTFWKRYKGGLRGKIWISSDGGKKFSKFLEMDSNINSPVLLKDRLYFISDHEGHGNLYSVDLDGRGLRKHTDFDRYYVRNAKGDGSKIVFQNGGDIYEFSPENGKASRVEIDTRQTGRKKLPRFVENEKFMTEYDLNHNGEASLYVVRGHLFAMGNWEGPVVEVSNYVPGRIRLACFLGNIRRKVAGVIDDGPEERIFIFDVRDFSLKYLEGDFGTIEYLAPSPDGENLAISNNRFQLFLAGVPSGEVRLLDENKNGIIGDPVWNFNGKFLSYTSPTEGEGSVIMIADIEKGEKCQVTTTGSVDYSPYFDPKNRYLYYLSRRTLDPVYDKVVFDLGYPTASKPYAAALRKDVSSPFRVVPDMFRKEDKEEEVDASVELEGIEYRSEPFPVGSSNYSQLLATEDRVMFLKFPVEGSMGTSLFGKPGRPNGELIAYSLEDGNTITVISGVSSAVLSGDLKGIMVEAASLFRVIKPDKTEEKMSGEESPSRSSGYVDTGRIKCRIEPAEEWKQMFREAWRLMRENYWNSEKVCDSWLDEYRKYEPLLDRIGSRYELSDVIRELQGELGTSHAYEINPEISQEGAFSVGKLGADLEYPGDGYAIRHIYLGNPSNENEKSPLLMAHEEIREGYVIETINGKKLTETYTPHAALVNHAGEDAILGINTGTKKFTTFVRTLVQDKMLLYRSWVESNRKYVHEKSGGKVGYLHIPDMGPNGFNEFHRLLPEESSHEGLIVDVRYNGGGHVSELILEKLNRKIIGFDKPRKGKLQHYPQYSVNGPIVAVTNEFAGSDGDIFSHSFKLYGIGPLIGTRTWGGVVGIDPRHNLVDGTIITQPQYAFWFKDVGWNVENYGTDPTIEVEYPPENFAEGSDPQLDRAISEAIERINRNGKILDDRRLL